MKARDVGNQQNVEAKSSTRLEADNSVEDQDDDDDEMIYTLRAFGQQVLGTR